MVQLDLQGYNPRNGQGLPKVGYKGPGNYSNSSTVGFEPQTSCMAVWQPNHYTKIARPLLTTLLKSEIANVTIKIENEIENEKNLTLG